MLFFDLVARDTTGVCRKMGASLRADGVFVEGSTALLTWSTGRRALFKKNTRTRVDFERQKKEQK